MAADGIVRSEKLHAGERFRDFTVLYPLASGTLSTVYAARQEGSRLVALKVPNERAIRVASRLAKFRSGKAEGDIATTLEHPHIVRTIAHGTMKQKVDYLVMEFMPGYLLSAILPSIHSALQKNPIRLLLQMAEALAYIHDEGYIHRDFNPRNIFALDNGDFKLFDFGLTIEIERAKQFAGNRTGTLSYLAPELIRRKTTDERTDIYAFGVLTYEILTLRRPYGSGTSLVKTLRLLNSEPTKPTTYYRELSPRFEALIMKAIEPRPENRYHSMREVIDDLKTIQGEFNLDYDQRIPVRFGRRW